jgi:uncharacterized protein (TIGR03083 family)
MADRTFDATETAAAFREASHWWRSLVGGVEDHQWDQPALGEWTVRELVAHGNRALKTVFEYVDGPAKDPTPIATAAQYFRVVLAEQTPHVHIAARAKREAVELGDPISITDDLAVRAQRVLDRTAPETDLHLFVGEMPLSQYLATRVLELVVHGTDLSEAIGIPSPPPAGAAKVALAVLVDLATAEDLGTIARLLTGRPGSLPLANVLA